MGHSSYPDLAGSNPPANLPTYQPTNTTINQQSFQVRQAPSAQREYSSWRHVVLDLPQRHEHGQGHNVPAE